MAENSPLDNDQENHEDAPVGGELAPPDAATGYAPLIDEPPLTDEDTRPRPPVTLAQSLDEMAGPPPVDPLADTAEIIVSRTPARFLLLATVFAGTICMCVLLVGFAGFAGYRDGLATNDAKITQTLATGIAEQYAIGVDDLSQGYAELAAARFAWIVETIAAPPAYARDSASLLATARAMASYTPTPPPTATFTPSPTATLTPIPTDDLALVPSATTSPLADPAYLYEQAAVAMRLVRYEEAIEWLDALRALAPDYRAAEAEAMLLEALTQQGRIYLRGQNSDGADMLARGVLLVYRANEIGTIESTLLGEAIFVEMYINARNYVNGGYYDNAIPILEELCAMNCGWSYQGVSVRNLLEAAQANAAGDS